MPNFAEWLQGYLAAREWTQAHFARVSGISPTQVANILSGNRKPGKASLKAIARALELPETEVLVAAGLMSKPPGWDGKTSTLVEWFQGLDEADQDVILTMARTMYHRSKQGTANAAKGRKAV